MSEKRLQHFVPQFHIRNFTPNRDEKYIGVYALKSSNYNRQASIRKQACRVSYYGADNIIEDALAEIEGIASNIIRDIIENQKLPNELNWLDFLVYIISLEVRTPRIASQINNSIGLIANSIIEENASELVSMHLDQAQLISLPIALQALPIIMDLDLGLLINTTKYPFICSDAPVVRLNLLSQNGLMTDSGLGYASRGLIMILPISSKHCIYLFDKDIYKIGSRKSNNLHHICCIEQIESLNLLQICNAHETFYFNRSLSDVNLHQMVSNAKDRKYNSDAILKEYENIDDSNQTILYLTSNPVSYYKSIPGLHIYKHKRGFTVNTPADQWRDAGLVTAHRNYFSIEGNKNKTPSEFIDYLLSKPGLLDENHQFVGAGAPRTFRMKGII